MTNNTTTETPTTTENDGATTTSGMTTSGMTTLLIVAAAGAAVSISLGFYAKTHTPTGDAIVTFGFPRVLPMKAWLTTGAATLVIAQVATAMWMWGRLPGVSRPAPA